MYDMTRDDLIDVVEMDDREWLGTDDIHPYKSCVPKNGSNIVFFPDITKFNAYLLCHYGAAIVEELSDMMYDGQLAGVCGVDGFHSQRLTSDKCRIDPRMSFWRRNKIEFIADIVVYLNVSVYGDDYCGPQDYDRAVWGRGEEEARPRRVHDGGDSAFNLPGDKCAQIPDPWAYDTAWLLAGSGSVELHNRWERS